MANWKYKLQIKDLLSDEDLTSEQINVLSETVEKRINEFMEGHTLPQMMTYDMRNAADNFYAIDDVEEFNNALDSLYDYCDYHSIWVE